MQSVIGERKMTIEMIVSVRCAKSNFIYSWYPPWNLASVRLRYVLHVEYQTIGNQMHTRKDPSYSILHEYNSINLLLCAFSVHIYLLMDWCASVYVCWAENVRGKLIRAKSELMDAINCETKCMRVALDGSLLFVSIFTWAQYWMGYLTTIYARYTHTNRAHQAIAIA